MSLFTVPFPENEPIRNYEPGSADRAALEKALAELKAEKFDIPLIIGGEEIRTGKTVEIRSPHNLDLVLGQYHQAGPTEIQKAVDSAIEVQKTWALMPWEHRASIFLKAADLLAGPYRYIVNAATMLAHSKNIFQAEIDAVCELVDFWRFNVSYMEEIFHIQPESTDGIWDRLDHRPLEGFIFAVTPFNFVSINGNLPTAPAMLGNVSFWKPASTAAYTSHFLMKILREAGLPAGVVNMVF
ncbi:MAG: aldehyde dehydrogenase family protein, partial [Candidatus Zixiibacteriota bacterium]